MISIEVLRSFPYFAGVSPDTLRAIAEFTQEHEFKAGEALAREGDVASRLCILRTGQVDVIYRSQVSDGSIVDTVVPGDLLGWSALLPPHKITATIEGRENGRYVAIDGERLRRLCEKDHTLGFRLMTWVAQEIRNRLQGVSVQLATSG
jgi:CRP-like cAMP-binding protein